jgi:16S rRNA processing protein RimM
VRLIVGRVARAHGIGGEVAVDVHTDDPDHRFALGQVLETDPAERGPLTVQRTRWHSGRLLVQFAQVPDRTGAEGLRGTLLVADSSTSAPASDDDEYWDHDLVGLRAETADGVELGVVADVLHPPGPPLLSVRRPDGAELLVPFVRDIVPTVDLGSGRLVVTPPDGLLDL